LIKKTIAISVAMVYNSLNIMSANILTKDIIFSHTTAENIYTKFLNLTAFPKGNISSPFSEDKNPSFKVWKNGTFKCNSSGKQGDVFEFVANLNQLDCKTQFDEVLKAVAIEMNLPVELEKNKKTVAKPLQKPLQKSIKTFATEEKQYKVDVTIGEMSQKHLAFWNGLGVEKDLLVKYKVNAVSNYSFFSTEKNKPFSFNIKNEIVAFCYEVSGNYEIYIPSQPEQNQKKVFNNGLQSDDIFGLEQLGTEKTENIIICAGKKDTIIAVSRGFKAVTFRSETHNPTETQIKTLQSLCNNLFICYDNDKGGENGRNAIIKRFPTIIPLYLPKNEKIKGYDVTDYFKEHSSEDFQKIIDLAVKNKAEVQPKNESIDQAEKQLTTIIHITEDYLNEHYKIRHNIIANEIEISKKDVEDWIELNENSLWIEMQKKNIKVPASTLEKILKSDFVPKFNPLIAYFESLPIWDKKTDYITQYSDYIKLAPDEDKEQYNYHFKKWCVRSVKCATDDNYFNKNAFVISDEGKGQNIGKTTWIRNLCPQTLSNYLKDDLPKEEKDAKIALTQNFIVNLDELASLSKQEINTLKSLFSADKIKVRFPYDKKEIVVRRVANFIGSTNLSTFLHDETGSVRWLCFVADKIDFSYKKDFDINNLWAQAFALSKDKNFDETITSTDMNLNELRNAKFQIQSPEKDLICRFLEHPTTTEETKILTSTEIQHYLSGFANSIRLNNNSIGKALTSLNFRKIRSATTTRYAVKYKDSID
jgi:predicted P-loop ATPase